MAKGTEAKKFLMQKIITALSDCYVGEVDKKFYFNSMENGECVQVCLSMTCPKTPIEGNRSSGSITMNSTPTGNFDWSGDTVAPAPAAPIEISSEEDAQVTELMRKLGITDD